MSQEIETTFYKGQPATSAATLATVPSGYDWIIDNVILTNTTGTAAVLQLNTIPSGGTAGVANELLLGYSVAPNGCVSLAGAGRLGEVLHEGDTIYGGQTTSAALTIRVTGRARQH
jgi:hypothetical protein